MTPLAYIALFGWIPLVVVLFSTLPGRQAATFAVVGAWLILPPYSLSVSGLPDYSKNLAASLGMLAGTLIFAPDRLLSFRPRWFDYPMLGYCLCGIVSSLQNELGIYDGLSDALSTSVSWGLPYLFGRLYLGDPESLHLFAKGMVIGGLWYVLPCLYEVRMSPQLLGNFYGMGGWQGLRYGGYRPNVFFATGLELGMWMTAVSLAAWWLWRCGALKAIWNIPFGTVLMPILFLTSVLCRSTGAIALLVGGMLLQWLTDRFKTRLLLVALLLTGPLYVTVRTTNIWTGQSAVDLCTAFVGPTRAESLEYRFKCENLLMAKALEQPVFGWGGWGRSAVHFDKAREKPVPTDGMWIIILGTKGFVGLILSYLALVMPAALFVARFPARMWSHPRLAAGSLAATFLGLYIVDCLLNGFLNIIYLTFAGGLAGLEPHQLRKYAGAGVGAGDRSAGRGGLASRSRPAAVGINSGGASIPTGRLALADRCRSLGRSFKQEGRPDEADAAWRQALELLTGLIEAEPGDPALRPLWCDCANDLAWLRANRSDPSRRDPGAAVAMARRLVEEYPGVATYWNTLGVACYRAGDDDSAVAALDRAIALCGGTAFDDVFLAMAHARLGDVERARQDLARALVRAERDYPGHAELARLCDEARSILAVAAATAR